MTRRLIALCVAAIGGLGLCIAILPSGGDEPTHEPGADQGGQRELNADLVQGAAGGIGRMRVEFAPAPAFEELCRAPAHDSKVLSKDDIASLAKLILDTPRLASLLEHRAIRGRTGVTSEIREAKEVRLGEIRRNIAAAKDLESVTSSKEMRDMQRSGSIQGVQQHQVIRADGTSDWITPPEYLASFQRDLYGMNFDGRVAFVFGLSQLPATRRVVEARESMEIEYVAEVLQLLVTHGVLSAYESSALMEAAYSATRTMR